MDEQTGHSVALAFTDLETTGLDPARHDIWEAAVILAQHVEDGDRRELIVEAEWCMQIAPANFRTADARGLQVGGFHERYDEGRAMTPQVAAQVLYRKLQGRVMVGAVPSFDAGFLARLFDSNNLPVCWHYQLVDVEALAAGFLAATAGPHYARLAQLPWKSTELTAAVGVTVTDGQRHTALGDATWAMDTYQAVYGLDVRAATPEP